MNGGSVHSLGIPGPEVRVLVAEAVVWLTLALADWRREYRLRRRFDALMAAPASVLPERRELPARTGAWVRRWAPPASAVVIGCVLTGPVTGPLLGAAGAYGLWRWQQGRARDRGAAQDRAVEQLPLAADLLAACLSAGAGPREAAEAVGESLGGPVGERLALAAAELRLGGEPARAWGRFGRIPGAAGLARCLERAGSSGAPAAEPVSRLAAGLRAERTRAAAARAQRAQVLITAPVGLCFLPAFLAIGVAPVVIGLAEGLLSGR
ncbi:type II secretion system F family protein [Streptomyces sp. SCSIO 30461]|uniref:type II secretion system F family protein n=1 Tax=Streptomyces sp. SCSIO 30461 TaxID=3118085 RepID=UPI0030CBF436